MVSRILSLCTILCLALSIEAVTNQQLQNNDMTVLNYALTLEHLEATFYAQGQARFTSDDFVAAGFTSLDYTYFNLIKQHEATHVSTLQSIIGASAVQACTYNFGVTDVKSYVALALILESTGVMAYDGAIKAIDNRGYQQAAATIATVEARHAEYLNRLNKKNPFPAPFDTPKTPSQIAQAIKGLIVSCPQKLVLPQFLAANLNNANLTFPNGTSTVSGVSEIVSANDIKTLNYALVLEHLEAAFYNLVLATYDEAAFTAAGKANGTYEYFEMIRQHENTHVTALTETIIKVGGTPYPVCTYDFSVVKSISDVFVYARIFENTGVQAYDGAVNTLTFKAFLEVAATIATVEARHAGFLNQENGESPFPDAFDPTKTPYEIAVVVSSFQSCDFTIYLPEVLTITALPPKASSGGFTGPTNPTNPTGATGATGSSNKSGATNPTGNTYPGGKTGKTGPSGRTGDTNPSNPTGKTNPSN